MYGVLDVPGSILGSDKGCYVLFLFVPLWWFFYVLSLNIIYMIFFNFFCSVKLFSIYTKTYERENPQEA